MKNPFKDCWKRDTMLDHYEKYVDNFSWWLYMPDDANEVARQAEEVNRKDSRAKLFLILAAIGSFIGIMGGGAETISKNPLVALLIWEIYRRIKIRILGYVRVDYEMDKKSSDVSTLMLLPFIDIAGCAKVLKVTGSESFSDTNHFKNNSGSDCSISYEDVSTAGKLPFPFRSNLPGATINLEDVSILAFADRVYVLSSDEYHPISYSDIKWGVSTARIIEEHAPSDAEIIGKTWQHVNLNGGPDRRYSENPQKFICKYGEVSISLGNILDVKLLISSLDAAKRIHKATCKES